MMDWETVSQELAKPLDPSAIKPPPQGKYGEYIEGYHAIREANRIFGYDGWSYAITSMEPCARTETTDRNGNPQIRVAYRCTVRVTVDGVTREGAAVGTGIAKTDSEGDAHESAVKEAETDAMKRALRSFGNTFGLALYEKDKSKREVGVPFDSAGTRKRIIAAINGKNTVEEVEALYWNQHTQDALAKMAGLDKQAVAQACTDRKHDIATKGEVEEHEYQ